MTKDEKLKEFRDRCWAKGMKSIYLIQRLEKPFSYPEGHPFHGVDNPFSFGGGLVNGGLSKEAMDLLRPIFSFDYMGSAEFEFGEVPKAFGRMAENIKNYTAFTMNPNQFVKKVKNKKGKEVVEIYPDKRIHVICNKDHRDIICDFIKEIANDEYFFHLKEYPRLYDALRPPRNPEYPCRIFGWLELDNGFMFFVDKEMFEKTCKLFELQIQE